MLSRWHHWESCGSLYILASERDNLREAEESGLCYENLQQTEAGTRGRQSCLHSVYGALWNSRLYFHFLVNVDEVNQLLWINGCLFSSLRSRTCLDSSVLWGTWLSMYLFFLPNLKNTDKPPAASSFRELTLFFQFWRFLLQNRLWAAWVANQRRESLPR